MFIESQSAIVKNLVCFMWAKGFSKLSLAKQIDIPSAIIGQVLSGDSQEEVCNMVINKVIEAFGPIDEYSTKTDLQSTGKPLRHDQETQKLLDGLDNTLEIYSLYV